MLGWDGYYPSGGLGDIQAVGSKERCEAIAELSDHGWRRYDHVDVVPMSQVLSRADAWKKDFILDASGEQIALIDKECPE